MKYAIFLSTILCLSSMNTALAKPDAGLIGPLGRVRILYLERNQVVVKKCPDKVVLPDRNCDDGEVMRQVSLNEFKNHLRLMLWSETIKIPDELKEKVELFKKWSPYNNQNLDQQEENLKRELKDLSANEDDEEGYIEEVGDENAEKGSSRKAAIKEQLRQIREAIKVKSATEEAVGIIHGMLEALFVKVTKTDEGNKPSYIVIKQNSAPSFEAALLDTYISHPALPKIFMSIAGQFEMLATEVTQAMWVEEMGSNPSNNNDGDASLNHPVEKVTWNQAQGFVSNLNSKNDGYQYRLPSGAEWGYAARAGNKGAYFFGDDVKHLKDVAWFADNSDHHTHAVASTSNDNGFGLWDMHGNVAEWVADAYSEKNDGRVIRGGSYSDEAKLCRSVSRDSGWPGDLHEDVGFRIVRTKR